MKTARDSKRLNPKELRIIIFVSIFFVCASVSWLLLSPNGILTYHKLKKELEQVQAKNLQLTEENKLLRGKIEKIQKDPAYLEEIARRDYNMLKKDEIVFEFK